MGMSPQQKQPLCIRQNNHQREVIVWNKSNIPVYKIRIKARFAPPQGRNVTASYSLPSLGIGESCRIIVTPNNMVLYCDAQGNSVKKHTEVFVNGIKQTIINPQKDPIGDRYVSTYFSEFHNNNNEQSLCATLLKLRVDAKQRNELTNDHEGIIQKQDKKSLYAAGLLAVKHSPLSRCIYYINNRPKGGIEIKSSFCS